VKTLIRPLALVMVLAWTAGLCGCATTNTTNLAAPVVDNGGGPEGDLEKRPEEPQEAPIGSEIGMIVRVNETDRYVIVNCRRLPSQGEEAKVIRNEWQAGSIRFAGPSHRPFASADIVTGQPKVGDLVLP